jgi:hypothetical protein
MTQATTQAFKTACFAFPRHFVIVQLPLMGAAWLQQLRVLVYRWEV